MDSTGGIEAARLTVELKVEQANVWPLGTNRAEAVGNCRCDRQHLMPARIEGSRQRLA